MSDEFDSLGILTFPGVAAPGPISLLGANPGDVLVSVTTITVGSLGFNYTDSFMREVQFLGQTPAPATGPLPYIIQTDSRNLSALIFVALVRKKKRDIPND